MKRPLEERPRAKGAQRGFALLIVLWALVPLSLLFLALSSGGRSEAVSAANLLTSAEMEAIADAAISTAVFDLLKHGATMQPGQINEAKVSISVRHLSGLVNPNNAGPALMRALLIRHGAPALRAIALAAALQDWRTPGRDKSPNGAKAAEYRAAGLSYGPPGAPFESLDEIGLVLGMTPELFEALRPDLTLFTDGDPDPASASDIVRAALRDTGAAVSVGSQDRQVVQITAVARRGKAVVSREAVIRIGASPDGRGFSVLTWDSVSNITLLMH